MSCIELLTKHTPSGSRACGSSFAGDQGSGVGEGGEQGEVTTSHLQNWFLVAADLVAADLCVLVLGGRRREVWVVGDNTPEGIVFKT